MSYRGRLLLAVAALLGGTLTACTTPASAQDNVTFEVKPNTAPAGSQVRIQGNCGGDDVNPATVRSRAFGDENRITLVPDSSGNFSKTVDIPSDTKPRKYRVTLTCAGESDVTVDLFVVDMAKPSKGPAAGGGGTADGGQPPRQFSAGSLALSGGLVALIAGGGLLIWRRRRAG